MISLRFSCRLSTRSLSFLTLNGRPLEEPALVLDLVEGRDRRVGYRIRREQVVHARAARASGLVLPAREEVDQQIAGDPGQPAAKAAPAGFPAVDGPGHRLEDILAKVVRVGILQPLAPGQPVNQRFVDGHELAPGRRIGRVAQLDDQRTPGCG